MTAAAKITAAHLQRAAVVYVRQSSLAQVRDHRESTARQYALVQEAARLGWDGSRISVIDADLGLSGRTASARSGFKELVGRVCVGEVGAILGLEVSRLARSSADLQRLLDGTCKRAPIRETWVVALLAIAELLAHDCSKLVVRGMNGIIQNEPLEKDLGRIGRDMASQAKHRFAPTEATGAPTITASPDRSLKEAACPLAALAGRLLGARRIPGGLCDHRSAQRLPEAEKTEITGPEHRIGVPPLFAEKPAMSSLWPEFGHF
jgi:resolvase-like protein